MSQNPLQNYFRQPKIYLKLPSLGKYINSDSISGDVEKLPVYGMTGMDQIIGKTPDGLLNGESTVKIIQSCCPTIVNAWDVSSIDLESLLVAIKIATFGNKMTVEGSCSSCNTENSYDIELGNILEYYNICIFESSVIIDDLIIKLKPLTYKSVTAFSLESFSLQKQLLQVQDIEDNNKKQELLSKIFEEFANLQSRVLVSSIDEIETPETVVSEFGFIKEWVDNCDQIVINKVKDALDRNGKIWKNPPVQVSCSNCGNINMLEIDLDPSNFFVNA